MLIFDCPTSQILLQGKKSSYYEVIHSLSFPECNAALSDLYEKIDLGKIFAIIDEIECISDVHKMFYRHIIKERYKKIIKASYELLRSRS